MSTPKPPPRRRRLVAGLFAIAGIALLLFGFGQYRAWQLRDSCTGNGGDWDAERTQCTFRGAVPALPSDPASR